MEFLSKLNFKKVTRGLPVILALALLAGGGLFLLDRADKQARDTIRKHHLDDLEQSLYLAYQVKGEYPPFGQTSWCGQLSNPANRDIRNQIEPYLRNRIEKYENPDKPFPSDPLFSSTTQDYFYWKRSPAAFELYSVLEADRNSNRTTENCLESQPAVAFDYGLNSILRQQP